MKEAIIPSVLVALVFAGGTGHAEPETVLFCNYDVLLTVDDSVGQINSRARVRDGHAIPIEFQDHTIDILIASRGDGGVDFAIALFERSAEYWYQVNAEPLQFRGELGIPVRYQWSDGSMSLDVAISVSGQRDLE